MKLLNLLASTIVILISSTFMVAQVQKYSRVKIYADDITLSGLAAAGVGLDHGEHKQNQYFISDFSTFDIAILKSQGVKYVVLIDDVSHYYVQQNKTNSVQKNVGAASYPCSKMPNYPTPAGFKLGSMGGYFTYDELLANLDSMAARYPTIFKAKTAISTTQTHEGRVLYWVKISDNASIDETEPELLYSALHHAREPASASQVIMYMYYLLENYTSDPQVKYLVDNTEMYFVPCINPDGYIHNETTNPNGGGMWRKNRRNNGDGTFGVDLNRNYGQMWGYDNFGSSNNTNSDLYRGPSAFSEPETQIMKEFCETHQFKLALNYHTYSNLLIYPWGHINDFLTPDSNIYKAYAKVLTQENNYRYGTGNQTVSYTANGGSDDWMYGEQGTKGKIFAMTPEAGAVNDGFWPAQNRIIDICKENISQNLHLAQLATKYAVAKEKSPVIVNKISDYLTYDLQRLGLDSPATYIVSLTALTNNVLSTGIPKSYTTLNLIEQRRDSISYSLTGNITEGDKVIFILTVDNGAYLISDTITKVYGTPVIAYTTTAGSMTGWASTGWNKITTIYHSPPSSITDSPLGKYPNSTKRAITQITTVNLTDAVFAELTFWARWEIEAGYDYVEVSASADNGITWAPLCGKYTKAGNANQNPQNPVFDGYQYSWVKELMNLSDYVGQNILIQFEIVTDQYTSFDGFYFDDLEIVKIVPGISGINSTQNRNTLTIQINPNPTNGIATVNFVLPSKNLEATLILYDALGRAVESRKLTENQSGLEIDTQKFNSGIYYYQLTTNDLASAMKKMVVIK